MKIAMIVEGETEKAFVPHLRRYLEDKLEGRMPRIHVHKYDGPVPKEEKLKRTVAKLLSGGKNPADHVIALTDVYTGTNPPAFVDAADANYNMRRWVGPEPRFHPHVALHDFEAWLLPYWRTIQSLAGHSKSQPTGSPESVDHDHPPSYWIKEIYKIGSTPRHYNKPRDGERILEKNGLDKAVMQCPELKALVNTIIVLCGGAPIT